MTPYSVYTVQVTVCGGRQGEREEREGGRGKVEGKEEGRRGNKGGKKTRRGLRQGELKSSEEGSKLMNVTK